MEKEKYEYDYATKCDCSEDDNCGCTYPNNMGPDFDWENQNISQCLMQAETNASSTGAFCAQKDK